MNKKSLLSVAIIVFANAFGAFAQSPLKNAALFSFTEEAARAGDKSLSVAAVSQRAISVNFAAIVSPTTKRIEISDFDGNVYEAVQRGQEGFVRRNADTTTWNGKIYGADNFDGDVILTAHKDALCGLIFAPSGVYEITPQAAGKHILVKIDQNLFPLEHPNDFLFPMRAGLSQNSILSNLNVFNQPTVDAPASPTLDDGSQIDVMIVYTTPVKNALGGTTQADAYAAQAVAATNTAYANSGITPRIRLVNSQEVNYSETGTLSAALNWVDSDATVAAARTAYRADAVSLFVESASDGCGLGYLMGNGGNTTAFASNAFTAVLRSCAVSNYSFPHELGHNQGANHNPADAGTTPAQAVFTYAFGHCVPGSGTNFFRTIMSYAGTECGDSTTRRGYFSNPLVNYQGQPTGTASRNNALTINNTALAFSRFRDSLAPTAASVSIKGRVLESKGRGIPNATVSITDANGTVRQTRSNPFGFYHFENAAAGATYVFNVAHKRFQFAPQTVSFNEDANDFNLLSF